MTQLVAPVPASSAGLDSLGADATARAVEAVDAAVDALASLARSQGFASEDGTLADQEWILRRCEDRLAAVRLAMLPHLAQSGIWEAEGAPSFPVWLAARDDVAPATARRDMEQATVLYQTLPATREAALTGLLSRGKVSAMVGLCSTEARTEYMTTPAEGSQTGEQYLLSGAPEASLREVQAICRYIAREADAAEAAREWVELEEREYLHLNPTRLGVHVEGFLTHSSAELLDTALSAITGVPAAEDERPWDRRKANALTDLARLALDNALTGSGSTTVRPHITVNITWEQFTQQVRRASRKALQPTFFTNAANNTNAAGNTTGTAATVESAGVGLPNEAASTGQATRNTEIARTSASGRFGADAQTTRITEIAEIAQNARRPISEGSTGPIPDTLLAQLACDGEFTRIIYGPRSEILNVGRAKRLVTGQMRKAVIARDRHCVWPGCHQPPNHCEVHHPHWWSQGGNTSIGNSALLCWHHHAQVHSRGITIRHNNRDEGGWVFTQSDGHQIRPPRFEHAFQTGLAA